MTFFYGKNKITIHDLSARVPQSQNTDEGSTYGNYEDLEKEVKRLNKLIINVDEENVHIKRLQRSMNQSQTIVRLGAFCTDKY